jgi:uncharacterized membrane protein
MIRRALSQTTLRTDQGFRWRSTESSRLEELSDAVIGFAITLLIVSLEVPRTFDELLLAVRGFAAFAVSFGLLIVIWYEHYKFFRRYGLHDVRIIVYNAILLFLILFYVYPLKFLFTISVNSWFGLGLMQAAPPSPTAPTMTVEQLSMLYLIYGVGWFAVWLVLGLFYQQALTQREALELTELEVFDTRASMIENFITASMGVISILLALMLPSDALPLAGSIYVIMLPIQWAILRWYKGRRRLIERRLAD